ncbi:hypothetical protein MD484_g2512, partial [Candolleomyces efflorescens]
MWVHGPAGYGKTAVAQTMSERMEVQQHVLNFNPLGATFFFWRTSPERNNPSRLVITLAYQLAIAIPDLQPHVEKAVKRNPMIVSKTLEIQVTKLIAEPFSALDNVGEMPHRLVIIDGLDECINSDPTTQFEGEYPEDQERTQLRVLSLIHTLYSHNLPLSFLILSRPEAWIKRYMDSEPFRSITETVDLYEIEGDPHNSDVEIFMRAELERISRNIPEHQMGKGKWPGERRLQRLLRRTGGHMLYAATALRHIDNPYDDPERRLQDILDTPSTNSLTQSTQFTAAALHVLYRQIMLSCPPPHRPLMLEVLEEILIFMDPTNRTNKATLHTALQVLESVSGRAPGEAMRALRCLHAVIRHQEIGSQNSFFIHSSFPEFLVNPQAALEFTVDLRGAHRRLAYKCLQCITSINSIAPSYSAQDDLAIGARYALKTWPHYWYCWDPMDEAEYINRLNALRTIDLSACIIRDSSVGPHSYRYARWLYDCRILSPNPLTPAAADQRSTGNDARQGTNAAQIAAALPTYLKSSVERAFLYMLHPSRVQTFTPAISFLLFYYLWSCWSHGDKWALQTDRIVKTWVVSRTKAPHLYQPLNSKSLFTPWQEYNEFMAWVASLSVSEEEVDTILSSL